MPIVAEIPKKHICWRPMAVSGGLIYECSGCGKYFKSCYRFSPGLSKFAWKKISKIRGKRLKKKYGKD